MLASLLYAATTFAVPVPPREVESGRAVLATQCREFVRRVPSLTLQACLNAELQSSSFRSVQGRPLLYRDVEADAGEHVLRVLVLGAIHGDELTAATLAFHWLEQSKSRTATPNPSLPIRWRFVPVVNPDGLLAQPPRRTNARGVDLNRNFPTPNWETEAPRYWQARTRRDPRRYPGRSPLSEPESIFIEAQLREFAPDLIVSIHAPLGVLDFDGPAIPPSRLGRLYLDQVGVFPGSLGHYGGVHRGIPVVTIELPHALRPPETGDMRQMWADLLRWIEQKLLAPAAPPESRRAEGAAPKISHP